MPHGEYGKTCEILKALFPRELYQLYNRKLPEE